MPCVNIEIITCLTHPIQSDSIIITFSPSPPIKNRLVGSPTASTIVSTSIVTILTTVPTASTIVTIIGLVMMALLCVESLVPECVDRRSLVTLDTEVTNPSGFGVPPTAVRPPGTMHLTLGVMSLKDEGVEQASEVSKSLKLKEYLASARPKIHYVLFLGWQLLSDDAVVIFGQRYKTPG
ncbi:uncharacterized protein FFB20_04230 [Fusarium fujikuroi]|uniref:Uncharacterized protein n=1 Tax=Fusarium fujikuroi TaxID=5127 RepID=A0A2H3R870_FUSFU|nr:uncharacterized protein FFE2_00695 [Fusarium fujikuroi]SCN69850.1 uncharacterized protein FFC1_00691 [Fusarium fujikuroi]SCN72794.1 uncharacterized protein FFB20_04230 [Fusarium fujikuroi]SCN73388.1 uncharacterized protein FFM5_00654 [Fusarium fujikuroi]SCO29052.1 uncharacterized protein FFNC_00694 [Fusarium fujikuroi]